MTTKNVNLLLKGDQVDNFDDAHRMHYAIINAKKIIRTIAEVAKDAKIKEL